MELMRHESFRFSSSVHALANPDRLIRHLLYSLSSILVGICDIPKGWRSGLGAYPPPVRQPHASQDSREILFESYYSLSLIFPQQIYVFRPVGTTRSGLTASSAGGGRLVRSWTLLPLLCLVYSDAKHPTSDLLLECFLFATLHPHILSLFVLFLSLSHLRTSRFPHPNLIFTQKPQEDCVAGSSAWRFRGVG